MRPLRFAKEHPVAIVVNMGIGYMVLPALLSALSRYTGVGVRLPQYGGSE